MKLLNGLKTDTLPIDNPEQSYIDGRNGVLSNKFQSASAEEGFYKDVELVSSNYNALGLKPVGVITVSNGYKIVFSYYLNSVLDNEIGMLDENNFYTSVVVEEFGFDRKYQITGVAKINQSNEIVVAFTDNNSTPKLINITKTIADVASGSFDVNDIELFPDYNSLYLDETNSAILDYGGNILSGTYYFAIKYKFANEVDTGYTNITRPFYINATPESSGIYSTGCPAETPTNKQIKLVFDDVDTRFDIMSIAVIAVRDGVTTSYEVADIYINGSTSLTYLFTGAEDLTAIDTLEIRNSFEPYKTIKSLTTVNKQLYGANVTQAEQIKYQKYANNIRVQFQVELVSVNDIKDYDTIAKKTLMPDEVYSVRTGFNMTDGSKTKLFHIAGRPNFDPDIPLVPYTIGDVSTEYNVTIDALSPLATLASLQIADPSFGFNIDGALATYFWETRCTCTTSNNLTGYYENNNEQYIDTTDLTGYDEYDGTEDYDGNVIANGRNLRTEVGSYGTGYVKHHKMPSMDWIKNELYPLDDSFGRESIPVISLRFLNVEIPQYLVDAGVESQFFVIDKKTPENSIVVGMDKTHLFATDVSAAPNTDSLLNVAANIIVRDAGAIAQMDAYNAARSNTIRIKSHCPDLLINQPAVSLSYIRYFLYTQYNFSNWITQNATYGWVGFIDLSDAANASIPALVSVADRFSEVNNAQYIPNNSIAPINGKNIDNRLSELCYHFIADSLEMNTTGAVNVREDYGGLGTRAAKEYSSLYSMNQYKQNIHNLYSETDFIELNTIYELVGIGNYDTEYIYGGDCFVCDYCYNAYGYRTLTDYASADYQNGIKIAHRYLTISRHNVNYRNVTADQNNYLPVGNPTVYLLQIYRYNDSILGYNQDYSYQHSMNIYECWNPYAIILTNHPNRIIRNVEQSNTDTSEGWSNFSASDYYELLTNNGAIQNIQGLSDGTLLIQNNSLYKTKSINRLATSSEEITLGVGDIFQFPPQEIISDKNGYIGTKYQKACGINKYGYVSLDGELGRLFIVSDTVKELSLEGMRNFFKDNCNIPVINSFESDDSPISSNGFTIEYDEKWNRLLISKKYFYLSEAFAAIYTEDAAIIASSASWFDYSLTHLAVVYYDETTMKYKFSTRLKAAPNTIVTKTYQFGINDGADAFSFWSNENWTLSYSFDFNCWAFWHDYFPDYYFRTRNQLLSFKDNELFTHNNELIRGVYHNYTETLGVITSTPYSFYVIPIFNMNKDVSKHFYSLNWQNYITDVNGLTLYNRTLDKIMCFDSKQCTGDITLSVFTDIDNIYTENCRYVKGVWHFNKLKDCVISHSTSFIQGGNSLEISPVVANINQSLDFWLKNPLVDKWLAVKFVSLNTITLGWNNNVHIVDVSCMAKLANR